ncbi:MAG: RNA polymerase sigma factor [Chitinophagaceae bacterium]|nr:RNA polymerase sigma factor [Chitinophagaceae bacterium]
MTQTFTLHPGYPDNWISKLKANDDATLRELYTASFPRVEMYVLNNNGTSDDAKDIYQEAFIAVWRNIQLDKVELTGADSLQGYLFRVAQYKWLDQLRSSKRKKTNTLTSLEITDDAPDLVDSGDEEYIQSVQENYLKMGEPCKDVLYRFYFLKQSLRDIASFFSWTEATAKNNKYRCLQRLRELVIPKNNRP